MWITIVWPDGRGKGRWFESLRELDQLIALQRTQGLVADLESALPGGLCLRLSPIR